MLNAHLFVKDSLFVSESLNFSSLMACTDMKQYSAAFQTVMENKNRDDTLIIYNVWKVNVSRLRYTVQHAHTHTFFLNDGQ